MGQTRKRFSDSSETSTSGCGPEVCPAGMCEGRGHLIVYGNPAMVRRFGTCTGMPAREALIPLPPEAFDLLDAVYNRSRPLACWIRLDGERWRMTAIPRIDAGNGEVYGVAFHLKSAAMIDSED